MEKEYFEENIFEKKDFTKTLIQPGEYELCTFKGCDFSNTDLSNISFTECTFNSCNLSLARLTNTGMREITFIDCKMLGLHFEDCSDFLFSVNFDKCILNLSSFFQQKLKNTFFKDCFLQEVDFTEAVLTLTIFENCDLSGAKFERTNLEKTDLRSSYNYSIDPEANKIKKAKFSKEGITGLLDKYDIEIY
ncbi:MAG: pentapeptide repeat-containing protein [Chitinophagaceae bacterium]